MQKKRLVIIPAFVLALIITGLASVPFFMDAQSLKAQIIAQLEKQLQRKVSFRKGKAAILTGTLVLVIPAEAGRQGPSCQPR
jgi:hypothetical protein